MSFRFGWNIAIVANIIIFGKQHSRQTKMLSPSWIPYHLNNKYALCPGEVTVKDLLDEKHIGKVDGFKENLLPLRITTPVWW